MRREKERIDREREREEFLFSSIRKIWENDLAYSEAHIHSQHTDYICN